MTSHFTLSIVALFAFLLAQKKIFNIKSTLNWDMGSHRLLKKKEDERKWYFQIYYKSSVGILKKNWINISLVMRFLPLKQHNLIIFTQFFCLIRASEIHLIGFIIMWLKLASHTKSKGLRIRMNAGISRVSGSVLPFYIYNKRYYLHFYLNNSTLESLQRFSKNFQHNTFKDKLLDIRFCIIPIVDIV